MTHCSSNFKTKLGNSGRAISSRKRYYFDFGGRRHCRDRGQLCLLYKFGVGLRRFGQVGAHDLYSLIAASACRASDQLEPKVRAIGSIPKLKKQQFWNH
jgi:hypothetical protein